MSLNLLTHSTWKEMHTSESSMLVVQPLRSQGLYEFAQYLTQTVMHSSGTSFEAEHGWKSFISSCVRG